MRSQEFGTLGIELDFLILTDVYLCEIVLVEIITLQDIPTLKDFLLFQF